MANFSFFRRVLEFLEDRADDLIELITTPEPEQRSPKQNRRSSRRQREFKKRVQKRVKDVVADVLPPEPEDRRISPQVDRLFAVKNTYPKKWSPRAREFFDEEPNTYRGLYSQEEWDDLQDAFYRGWIVTGISKPEHEQGRQDFYDISGVTEASFDWEAFRRFITDIGTPELAA